MFSDLPAFSRRFPLFLPLLDRAKAGGENGGMAYLVFRQLVVMALIAVVSYIVARIRNYGEKESSFLSYILLYVITPCLMLSTYDRDYDPAKSRFLAVAFALSIGNFAFQILLSECLGRRVKKEERSSDMRLSVAKMGVVYSNSGFIAIPICLAAIGPDSLFYVMAYNLVFNVVLWTHGMYITSGRISARKIFTNPSVISALFSLALYFLPLRLPYVLHETVRIFGDLNTAVSMIILGIVFATFRKGQTKGMGPAIALECVLRLLASPLCMILFLSLFRTWLGSAPDLSVIAMIMVIVTACPCGMVTTTFAVLFHKDAAFASMNVAVSTVLCVATLPLSVYLAQCLLS